MNLTTQREQYIENRMKELKNNPLKAAIVLRKQAYYKSREAEKPGSVLGFPEIAAQAMILGAEALEYYNKHHRTLIPRYSDEEECYVCPLCEFQLEEGQNYCDDCGTHLAWRTDNE